MPKCQRQGREKAISVCKILLREAVLSQFSVLALFLKGRCAVKGYNSVAFSPSLTVCALTFVVLVFETGVCCVTQAGIKLEILLHQCWHYKYVPPCLASFEKMFVLGFYVYLWLYEQWYREPSHFVIPTSFSTRHEQPRSNSHLFFPE